MNTQFPTNFDLSSVQLPGFGNTITPPKHEEVFKSIAQSQQPTEQPREDYKKYGLQNKDEYDLMLDVKKQGGTEKDFMEILNKKIVIPQEVSQKPVQDKGNLLQKIGGALKVESKFDLYQKYNKTFGDILKNELKSIANSGRLALNLPGDTIEFVGDMANIIAHPIETIKGTTALAGALVSKIGLIEKTPEREAVLQAIKGELNKNFGTGERAIETITQNPFDAITAVFGGAGLAKSALVKTGKVSPGVISKLESLQEMTNPINIMKTEGKLLYKPVVGTVKGVGKGIGAGYTKLTGVNFDTVKNIVKNPELFKQAEKGNITRMSTADEIVKAIDNKASSISDIGKEYSNIRKLNAGVKKRDVRALKLSIDDVLQKSGIDIIDGKLDFSNSQIGQSGNRKVITDAYNLVHNRTKFEKGGDWLNLRQSFDDTINWKSEATDRAKSVVRAIRGEVDKVAKEKLTGLKELDAKFSTERSEFNKVSALIRNKDGSLKDNYISIISNITGKGKELKLERLKKIIPDIEGKVNALKALEDVELSKGNKVGSYAAGAILGGGALGVGTGGVSVLGALATYILTRPQTLVNILKAYNVTTKTINSISNKVKNGIKLTKKESVIVANAIKDQVIEKGANLADDIADKTGAKQNLLPTNSKQVGKSLDDFKTTESAILDIPSYLRLYKNDIIKINNTNNPSEIVKIVDNLGNEGRVEVFSDFPNLKSKYIIAKRKLDINRTQMNRAKTGERIEESLYHGTNADFNKIEGKFSNKSSGTGVGKGHIFYTDNIDVAKSYGDNIKKVKVRLENPLVLDNNGMNWNDIKYKGKEYNINEVASIAENEGYDGLIIKNIRDTGGNTKKPGGFTVSTSIAVFK